MPRPELLTHNNLSMSRQDWADYLGISIGALRERLKLYPLDIALSTTKGGRMRRPKPRDESSEPTRTVFIRAPESLHIKLKDKAREHGVSINAMCVAMLEKVMWWSEEPDDQLQEIA